MGWDVQSVSIHACRFAALKRRSRMIARVSPSSMPARWAVLMRSEWLWRRRRGPRVSSPSAGLTCCSPWRSSMNRSRRR
jgi:hypothetical protein